MRSYDAQSKVHGDKIGLFSIPGFYKTLELVTHGILSGPDLTLKPFFKIYDRRYMVYWDIRDNGRLNGK
jgi:hypothetical protein